MERDRLQGLLERFHDKYNQRGFIEDDPVSIPHSYTKLQDREIMGFFAAVFAWGLRITTINKCRELSTLMDDDPHAFITGHKPRDLRRMEGFRHRTFNSTDLLYFIAFFRWFYSGHQSLEEAFTGSLEKNTPVSMRDALGNFHQLFFSLEFAPQRTHKHVANAWRNASCKRLNMFLRWMVRRDDRGVDLGLWKRIPPSALMCPLDVHVERSARLLGLVERRQRDWKTVEELTASLRRIDPTDPVRFDFALFGMGMENWTI
jgi:uncharacterized protein (TIGR02757 family)